MRKAFISVCILAAMGFAGCGKQGEDKEKKKVVADNTTYEESSREVQTDQQIPLYQYEEERGLDEDSVTNFAFIDEEESARGDGVEGLEQQDSQKVASVKDGDWDDVSEETSLAWDDDFSGVEFKTVNFDINGNNIRNDQKKTVTKNLHAARKAVKEGKNIVVAGHCCPIGAASYNMSLSEKRAKAIKDEMVKNGIPEEKIRVLGCGQESPIVLSDSTDRESRIRELAPNRRAEISLN